MKNKQTRRSISVSGELYEVLKARAAATESSQSGLVEEAMRRVLGMEPRDSNAVVLLPVEAPTEFSSRLDLIKATAEKPKVESAGGIFTF